MGLIFFLSAQPDLDSGLGLIDTIGRKVVHFAIYGLLAVLWRRALASRMGGGRATLGALLIAALYAATDEYHQSFVSGRDGSPFDWAIDSAGAVTAMLLARSRGRRELAG